MNIVNHVWTSETWKKAVCRNTVITKILIDEGAFRLNIKTRIILLMTHRINFL